MHRLSPLRLGVVVLACLVLGLGAMVSEATRATPLLQSADLATAAQSLQTQPDPTVVRSRYITIDLDALPSPLPRLLGREPALPLELFPDVFIRAIFERFDPNPDGVTWVGHVENVPLSSVTLVYGGGLLAGSVVTPGGTYSIRPAPADVRLANPQPGRELHVVSQINQAAFPKEAPPVEVRLSAEEMAAVSGVALADTAEFVDVMVLYTPTALIASGGTTAINNLINLGMSETNTSYANSGIAQRVRLAHVAQVDYTETSSFSTSLSNLRAGVGALSGVAALRDTHRADVVMLLVRPQQPDACGIAFLMTSVSTAFAPSGYSVTDTSCIAGYTFAHELGHNMGARHDWYVDNSITPFSYAHGHVNPTGGQRWRTIMAYNDLCSAQGFSCGRVLYWANPTTVYLPYCTGRGFNCDQFRYWYFPGTAMGVPAGTSTSCRANILPTIACDADDARTLNNTALTVANFRQLVSTTARRR